jgi:hypothetical protein
MTQDKSQKPVAWLLTDKNINLLQVDSIQRLIDRLKHAHHTDLRVRINGQDEWFQADWLEHMVRATPPQRTEQEPVAWWNDTGTHIDLNVSGRGTPLYTTPPQRTWVGLTNNELQPIADEYRILFGGWVEDFARAIEAKLKEKNT